MAKTVYTYMGFSAGYRDVHLGSSYIHSVYRTFSKAKISERQTEVDVEELYKICPMKKEDIDSLLDAGKMMANVHYDIYDGEEVEREHWEAGSIYGKWHNVCDQPALDAGWYDKLLYKNSRIWKLLNSQEREDCITD